MITKLPPQSIEAERAVLGACIISKEALGSAIEILKPDDFYDTNHKLAFETLTAMYLSDRPVDFITVTDEFNNKGVLNRIGGYAFLSELAGSVTTTANINYHAEIVRERAVRRRLIDAGNKIISMSYDTGRLTKEIIEEAEKLIFDAAHNKSSSEFRRISEIIPPVISNVEENFKKTDTNTTGFPSGFSDLDSYTGGFQKGSLTIIAARPSMGKTAFAVNIAQFGGEKDTNLPVLIFSLEMPAEQLVLRMISAESHVNLSQLNTGTFDTSAFSTAKKACEFLSGRNIYINDDSNLTAIDFRTRCRRFKNKHPELALVVVDYLQLMSSGEGRNDGRQQEVSDISRMLKATARELNCPVIALSQLSRAAEQRTEKKPQLSDLRDSGAIEQDADVVLLLFREDYYSENENNDLQDSKADIRVAKNRNGSTGVFHLTFKREITRFFNYGS